MCVTVTQQRDACRLQALVFDVSRCLASGAPASTKSDGAASSSRWGGRYCVRRNTSVLLSTQLVVHRCSGTCARAVMCYAACSVAGIIATFKPQLAMGGVAGCATLGAAAGV
jgi:hypothetical protein